MSFAPVDVEALVEPAQLFRCEPYRVTLMARACVLRQRAMREERGTRQGDGLRKGPRPEYDKCVGCAIGAQVDVKVGASVGEAPPSRGGLFTLGRRASAAFTRKKANAPAPVPAEPPKTSTCSWCGQQGHASKACPAREDARAMEAARHAEEPDMKKPPATENEPAMPQPSIKRQRRCKRCGEPGHRPSTCVAPATAAELAERKPKRQQGPRKCSRCGSLEHDLRRCKAPLRPRIRKPIGKANPNDWPRPKAKNPRANWERRAKATIDAASRTVAPVLEALSPTRGAGRPTKGASTLELQLSVRFDPDDVRRLDAVADAARQRAFGLTVTRLDALRLAMHRGLDSLEAEIEDGGSARRSA